MKTFITLLSSLLLIVQMPAYAAYDPCSSDKVSPINKEYQLYVDIKRKYHQAFKNKEFDEMYGHIETLTRFYTLFNDSDVKDLIVCTLSDNEEEVKIPIVFWAYLTANIELLNSTINAFGDEPEILEKFLTETIMGNSTGNSLTLPLVVETFKSENSFKSDSFELISYGGWDYVFTKHGEYKFRKKNNEDSVHKDMILRTIEALDNNPEALREWVFSKNKESLVKVKMIINAGNAQEIASMINIFSDVLSEMPQKLYHLLLDELSDRALVEEILIDSNIANNLKISFDDMHASYVGSLMEDYTITLHESITSPDLRIITEKLIREYQNTQDNDVKNKIKELLQMTNKDNESVLHSVAHQRDKKDKSKFLMSVIDIVADNLDMLKLQENVKNYTFIHRLYSNGFNNDIVAINAIIDRFNNDTQRDFLVELLSLKNSDNHTVVDHVIRYEPYRDNKSGIVDKVKDVFKDDDALKKIITIE